MFRAVALVTRPRPLTTPFIRQLQTMNLRDIVRTLDSIAPPTKLAEDWDNVGLLVEPSSPSPVTHVLLTNDLTEPVMTEIQKLKETGKRVGLIVSYHPPIFRPFKRLTQSTAKERIIIRAIESQIAVYSPHTAHDSLWGGVNDWILSCFHGNGLNGHVTPLTVKKIPDCKGLKFNVRGVESLHKLDEVVELLENNVTRECATTTEQTNIDGQ